MLLTWGQQRLGLLDLQLLGANSLDSRFTTTRATPAKRYNSSGILVTEAANTPRFDFNPFTLAARGLMCEPTRTNIALRSNEFDNAVWTKTNCRIDANTTVSPDGTNNADTLTVTTASNAALSQGMAATANLPYTITLDVHNSNASWVMLQWSDAPETEGSRAWFDLSTGTKGTVGAIGTGFNPTNEIIPGNNGWSRLVMTATLPLTSSAVVWLKPVTANGGTTTAVVGTAFDIYECQVEQAAGPSSIITTGASTATRDGDVMVAMGMAAPVSGSMVLQFLTNISFTSGYIASFDDGTGNNAIQSDISTVGAVRELVLTGGVPQCSASVTGLVLNSVNKAAMRWERNNFGISRAGGAVVTDTAGTIPSTNRFQIGGRAGFASSPPCIWLQRVQVYGQPFPNATLQALAA